MGQRSPFSGPILVAATLLLGACAVPDFLRGYIEAPDRILQLYEAEQLKSSERGAILLAQGSLGALSTDTLQTSAVPWRVAAGALVLHEAGGDVSLVSAGRLRDTLSRFGFIFPEQVTNWPEGLKPLPLEGSIGLVTGKIDRTLPRVELTIANLSCAGCHAGPSYDLHGQPDTSRAWIGMPNTSFNPEAYVGALYAAFKFGLARQADLLKAIRTLFPETSPTEIATIQERVLPALNERLAERQTTIDRPFPFDSGAPGLTNGVAALKLQLGVIDLSRMHPEFGFTSIPELQDRTWRSTLLWDGAYAAPTQPRIRPFRAADISDEHLAQLGNLVSFFSVPAQGLTPARANENRGDMIDIMAFLNGHRAQRFPGRIDRDLATKGERLYASHCAVCHGHYNQGAEWPTLVGFSNWHGDVGTDANRLQVMDEITTTAIRRSLYGELIEATTGVGYAAPPLGGIWASAPYLHNGSVPSLWHLMHPEQRPAMFMTGGHALDFHLVGIAGKSDANGSFVYADEYRPWSTPALIDTSRPGLSNKGHAREFSGLSEDDKSALIEYLKLL